MKERKIIYITKKALDNLPDDIPVYVLIDPELEYSIPKDIQNVVKYDDVISQSDVNESSKIEDKLNIECFEVSKSICEFSIKTANNFEIGSLMSQTDFINDDFINSVDIIATNTSEINYDQIKTPEYAELYEDRNECFINDFYDCLRENNVSHSDCETHLRSSKSLISSTAAVSKTLESFISNSKNSYPKENDGLFTVNASNLSLELTCDDNINNIFSHDSKRENSQSNLEKSNINLHENESRMNKDQFYFSDLIVDHNEEIHNTLLEKEMKDSLGDKILFDHHDYKISSHQLENENFKTQENSVNQLNKHGFNVTTASLYFPSINFSNLQTNSMYSNVSQMSLPLDQNKQSQIWGISPSLSQIDVSQPPPVYNTNMLKPHLPSQFSIPPPPIEEAPAVENKWAEIEKIKIRRSAKRVPKKRLWFREYQYVEMHINEQYLVRLNKNKKTILGTKSMTNLEDKFENEILHRGQKILNNLPKWEPIDRSQFKNKTNSLFDNENEEDKVTENSNESDKDSTSSDIINSDSEEDFEDVFKDSNFTKYQINQLAHIEKKVAATRKRLKLDLSKDSDIPKIKSNYNSRRRPKHRSVDQHVPTKKAKQSTGYLTIQKNNLHNNAPVISNGRTIEQQAEINHKLKHPYKLHSDIWYNEFQELNDGPACSCAPKYKIGPLHNDFPGEKAIPPCQSNSNNYGKLYHYKLVISPVTNFLSASPTVINYKNKEYSFTGYSIFTHKPLIDIPPCQVVRYNIVYFLSLVKEDFPIGFTVRTLDLITDYIFTDLLELLDLQWWPLNTDTKTSCRAVHLLPRFERPISNNSVELLSVNVILKWLLKNSEKPLFDVMDLPRIHSMSQSEWSEHIDSLRGTLASFPGKKPASIRIDQIDRISIENKQNDDVMIFPVIVHMSMAPMKLGLTREPAYKRLLRNFLKLQYLILNRPEVSQEDRAELNNLARLLENFEMNGIQRREFTVEISSDGFYRTGLNTDVVQFSLCIPSITTHIRFHLSLADLENRLKYVFKDKSLLHQALTHPSFRNTNYGTNPDHYQNTATSCGLRHIEYGDKISLYRSFRKKGLSKMVQVMSHMPYRHETRSNIFGNERLECLGDAVIELITSVHLFYMFPELSEGHLDAFRQSLVQNHYLAELSVRLGFHNYILYTHNMDFSYDSTITHARSDGFEAVMAAITLDGGLDEADRIFGSALFADDQRIHKVWCEISLHPLQQQFINGDRHVIQNSPLFENLTKLEDRLGIQFTHIRLLAKAMTIRKTGYNLFTLGDNQRLEFLGDSLLKYLTTDYLFKHFPRHHEGHISLLRNTLVNRYTQATVCTELGLDEFIIRKETNKSITPLNKSNEKPKADLLEAFLGALFVDKDLKWVERFCQVCFWPRLVDFILNQSWNDPKSRLQQCCLTYRSLNEDPEIAHYKLITTFGSTDHREFKVAVYFRGTRLATGFGKSIQTAQMNAASQALERYKTEFRQLNYQEKVITDHYDYNTREKIMHQFENWDSELIDKFVDSDNHFKSMNKKLAQNVRVRHTIDSEKSKEKIKNMSYTSSLGELLKNIKKA